MKHATTRLLAAILLLSTLKGLAAPEVDVDGATPGKWTMDLEAARKIATEKKLPILLDFSGSDWCGWCKLMERSVFSEPKWKDYAKDNILMVVIDFPKDTSIVPQKYVKRNNDLKDKYEVEGFPTFVVLDDDGETVLGRLSAGEDKTPESFTAEVRSLLRYRSAEVAKYTKTLSPDDKQAYQKIVDQMTECRKSVKTQEQQIVAAQKKIEELQKKAEGLVDTATEFRAAKMDAAKYKQFKELKTKLEEAKKKFGDWVKTQPERSPENQQKYTAMMTEIKDTMGKLAEY